MWLLLLSLMLTLPLGAQQGAYKKDSNHPALGNPEAIERGRGLFLQSCAACHGPDGSGGRGPNLVKRPNWHMLSDEGVFNIIRDGASGAGMPPTALSEEDTWSLVAFVHVLIGPAAANPAPGEAGPGAALYWSEKAGCSGCHAIHGRGGLIAPDLTNVADRLPVARIREAVLTPSIEPYRLGSEGVTVQLRDGTSIQGVARNRDSYSLQVIDFRGVLHLIQMHDVRTMEIGEFSPMPSDYGTRFSATELANLFAFLSRLTLRRTTRGPH